MLSFIVRCQNAAAPVRVAARASARRVVRHAVRHHVMRKAAALALMGCVTVPVWIAVLPVHPFAVGDLGLVAPKPIPEPSGLLVFGIGMVGLALINRNRR